MSIGASSYVLPSRRAEQQEAVYHLLDDDDDLVLAHFTTKSTTSATVDIAVESRASRLPPFLRQWGGIGSLWLATPNNCPPFSPLFRGTQAGRGLIFEMIYGTTINSTLFVARIYLENKSLLLNRLFINYEEFVSKCLTGNDIRKSKHHAILKMPFGMGKGSR